MQRTKSGPAAVGATASPEPGRTSENHQTFAYRNANAGNASSVVRTPTRPRVSSSLLRGIRYAIIFEIVGAALVIGAWILVGFFANHLSDLTFGLGIVGVGVLFGVMLSVES